MYNRSTLDDRKTPWGDKVYSPKHLKLTPLHFNLAFPSTSFESIIVSKYYPSQQQLIIGDEKKKIN